MRNNYRIVFNFLGIKYSQIKLHKKKKFKIMSRQVKIKYNQVYYLNLVNDFYFIINKYN